MVPLESKNHCVELDAVKLPVAKESTQPTQAATTPLFAGVAVSAVPSPPTMLATVMPLPTSSAPDTP